MYSPLPNNNKNRFLKKDGFPIREHFKFVFENPRLFDKIDFTKRTPFYQIHDEYDEQQNERIKNKLLPIVTSDYDLFFAQLTERQRDLLVFILSNKFITSKSFHR